MSASGLLIVIVINGSVRLSEQRRCGFCVGGKALGVARHRMLYCIVL